VGKTVVGTASGVFEEGREKLSAQGEEEVHRGLRQEKPKSTTRRAELDEKS